MGTRVAINRRTSRRRNTRLRCDCGGYWFPHRKGGGACDHGERRAFYIALRNGATLREAMTELTPDQLNDMFPLTKYHDDETHIQF